MEMAVKAVMLLLCDNRAPWPTPQEIKSGATLSPDSVVGLPLKRDSLRKYASQADYAIAGEVILELEKSYDMEFVVNAAVNKLRQSDGDKVLCGDRVSLEEAGIYAALRRRLEEHGLTLIEAQ